MNDWLKDRIDSALRGENPMVMVRMTTGFAVIGDSQYLPGYSLLLCDDPRADHLSDLPRSRRREFLFEMSLVGEAIETVCRPRGLRRVNYEVLGNSLSHLHAHVHPRYDWEPPEMAAGPVWRYPKHVRDDPANAYSDDVHAELRTAITEALEQLVEPQRDGPRALGTIARFRSWRGSARIARGPRSGREGEAGPL